MIVTAVIDEEYASLGTQSIVKRWHADAAVVTEATGLDLCIAHKGFVWLDVEVTGEAAHGSRPDLGIDAIAQMGKVLTQLDQLNQRLQSSAGHPLLGSGWRMPHSSRAGKNSPATRRAVPSALSDARRRARRRRWLKASFVTSSSGWQRRIHTSTRQSRRA